MPQPRNPGGMRAWKDLMNCTADPATPVVLYNPASFDPETALPARLRRFAPYARWFVHAIYTRRVFDKRGGTDFIPLHAAHLRRVLPQDHYREIIDALVAAGVVETDRHYIKGEKSMGYRLAGRLQDERHTRHVVEHRMMAKKLRGRREDRAARLTLDVHRHLWRHLRALEIDFPEVMKDQPRLAVPADCIRDGQWFMKVCEYGRVHTSLTNMPGELRRCLRYRGEPLVNIDVRNSQPLLLGVLLVNYFSSEGKLSSVLGFHFDQQSDGTYLRLPEDTGDRSSFNTVSTDTNFPPPTPL